MKTIKVPFFQGNLMSYPWFPNHDKLKQIEWKDSFVFTDDLVWDRFERGRSAVTIYLKSKNNGKEYPCFISSFEKIILSDCIEKRKLVTESDSNTMFSGHFGFIKRGENYSITPVILLMTDDFGNGKFQFIK